MTPFSSVAMLEKLALLKIAFCNAPVLSKALLRRISAPTSSTLPTSSSGHAGVPASADIVLLLCRVVRIGAVQDRTSVHGEERYRRSHETFCNSRHRLDRPGPRGPRLWKHHLHEPGDRHRHRSASGDGRSREDAAAATCSGCGGRDWRHRASGRG